MRAVDSLVWSGCCERLDRSATARKYCLVRIDGHRCVAAQQNLSGHALLIVAFSRSRSTFFEKKCRLIAFRSFPRSCLSQQFSDLGHL